MFVGEVEMVHKKSTMKRVGNIGAVRWCEGGVFIYISGHAA